MKRFLALVLSFAMLLTLCPTVWAAESETAEELDTEVPTETVETEEIPAEKLPGSEVAASEEAEQGETVEDGDLDVPEETSDPALPQDVGVDAHIAPPEETVLESPVGVDDSVLPEERAITAPVLGASIIARGYCGDNLTWTLDYYGFLTISGSGKMKDYSDYNYYNRDNSAPWYSQRSSVKCVTISDSVTSIGSYAFDGCSGLQSITIPDSVTSIGEDAFDGCSGLKSVTIGNGVTTIGWDAFRDCSSLTSVTIPDSVTTIVDGAFYDCSSLTSVTIGDSVTSIGGYAFYGCSGLQSMTLSFAGDYTFPDIFGDSSYVPSSLKSVTITGGTLPENAFRYCSRLTSVTIGDGVTSIGDYAFWNCSGLTSVTIPDSVTSIGEEAFRYCSGLTSITIPDSVTSIGSWAFLNTAYYNDNSNWIDGILYIGHWVIDAESGLSGNCVISDSVTSIGDYAFYGCYGLTSVTIPDSVTRIGNYAFYGCTGLTSVTIPDSVTSIGDGAFRGCSGLTSVTIPGSVTSIGDWAFYGCSDLTSVTIPDSVTSIGNGAFYGCSKLTSVVIPNSVISIGSDAFYNCSKLTSVVIPDSVTSIGSGAFEDCSSLTAFSVASDNPNYSSQDGVLFDKAKTELIQYPAGNTGTSYTIPSSVTSIGRYAFDGCSSLASVVIPNSMTSIGNYAFAYYSGLTSITIPDSVTSIGEYAFSGCSSNLTVYAMKNSYAATWAKNNGYLVVLQDILATGITLPQSEITIAQGKSKTLIPTITPANCTETINWKSTDPSVVTVSSDGVIKGIAPGTANVKIIVGSVSATCKITVIQQVTSITLNKTSLTLDATQTYQLTATVNPSNAENPAYQWSVADPTVAAVSETGLVVALSKGTTIVTASALDGSNVTKSCTITVEGYAVSDVSAFESPHSYASNCDDFWVYMRPGAGELKVTFDSRTSVEDGFDFLYIYDGSGQQIGKYTGTELAGKTISVTGDTVKIKLDSDGSGNEWGFKVSNVAAKRALDLDLNGDKSVTSGDMQCLFTYLSTGKNEGKLNTQTFRVLADVNGDGDINILDYQALYEAIK